MNIIYSPASVVNRVLKDVKSLLRILLFHSGFLKILFNSCTSPCKYYTYSIKLHDRLACTSKVHL